MAIIPAWHPWNCSQSVYVPLAHWIHEVSHQELRDGKAPDARPGQYPEYRRFSGGGYPSVHFHKVLNVPTLPQVGSKVLNMSEMCVLLHSIFYFAVIEAASK